jgi:hypothetical protein
MPYGTVKTYVGFTENNNVSVRRADGVTFVVNESGCIDTVCRRIFTGCDNKRIRHYVKPFLKEGDDPADHPPRAVAWKPLPEAHDKAKAAWEENDYLGLGWSKKDIDMSFDKVEMN